MSLWNNGHNHTDNLERFTYRVIRKCYPEGNISREEIEICDSRGQVALPDFVVRENKTVLLEVTGLSYFAQKIGNKTKQHEVVMSLVDKKPEYEAIFFWGECFLNPDNVLFSLQLLKQLARGHIDTISAENQLEDRFCDGMVAHAVSQINWNKLYNDVVGKYFL